MYQIKQFPEDFQVKEISNLELKESGLYSIFLLKKTNYATIRACEQISKFLNLPLKFIGYAGTKDKNAITEQYISIRGVKKALNLDLKDIELTFKGYSDKPVSLGDLVGNEFIITIRNLTSEEIKGVEKKIKEKILMPNYFGEQRFSKGNVEIGKNLLKQNYKEAVSLILSSNSDYNEKIREFAEKGNYPASLRVLPKKLLLLYLHSYQSYLWNKTLAEYIKQNNENIQIPILGFGSEFNNKTIEEISKKIMAEESITFRNFINKSIPELSSEGALRVAFVEIENLKILEKGNDWIKLNFKLKKGSYATVAIAFLFNSLGTVLKDYL